MQQRKKKCALIYLILFAGTWICISPLQGQQISIKNVETDEPVSQVYIYSSNSQALTDNMGNADISAFHADDTLFFQHIHYKSFYASKEEIICNEYVILLEEKGLEIEEVIVSANKWIQDKRQISQHITSVSRQAAQLYNPQTAADLLNISGKVFIQKSQQGGGSPMIRGFAANRVLIVVDGVRMNNAIFRSGNLQNVISLDPFAIQNTEVLFGPGSVIYGSDALGGVMNFSTLNPKLSQTQKISSSAESVLRYSSANKEKTVHTHLKLAGKKWASLTSITFSDYDDLRMGSRMHDEYLRNVYASRNNGRDTVLVNKNPEIQRSSGYNQLNLMQKFRFKPNRYWDLNYGFHYSRSSDIPRYDRLIELNEEKIPESAEWYYGPQKWMMHNLQASHTFPHVWADHLRITLAFQEFEESRHDRRFNQNILRNRFEKVQAYSLNADVEKQFGDGLTAYYGVEWIKNDISSRAWSQDIKSLEHSILSTRYPDGAQWQSMAAYISGAWKFHPQWTLNGGLRYNHTLIDAQLDSSFYHFNKNEFQIDQGAVTGNLGLVFRPSEAWKINFHLSSGFRAPNIDDAAKLFDSEPGNIIIPNDNLKPEYAINLDLGFGWQGGDWIQWEATGFYTRLSDVMVRANTTLHMQDSIIYDGQLSQVQTLVNAEEADLYGAQVSLDLKFTQWLSFYNAFTYIYGRTNEGEPLRHVSPAFGRSTLRVKLKKIRADFFVAYNGKLSADALAPSEVNKPHLYAENDEGRPYSPSWYTLNTRFGFRINDSMSVNAGLENILDVRYRTYSSGIVAPGRNLVLSLQSSF